MRIISGKMKGKALLSPSEGTRPSTDRTRQALFSMLQNVLEGAQVLDLFAGSGALGFESLSRGAECVVAVEHDQVSCRTIAKNAKNLEARNYKLLCRGVIDYLDLEGAEKFDLVFADPPYEQDFSNSLLLEVLSHSCWSGRLNSEAYFITESPQDIEKTGLLPGCWNVVTKRNYGKCHITVLQYAPE